MVFTNATKYHGGDHNRLLGCLGKLPTGDSWVASMGEYGSDSSGPTVEWVYLITGRNCLSWGFIGVITQRDFGYKKCPSWI